MRSVVLSFSTCPAACSWSKHQPWMLKRHSELAWIEGSGARRHNNGLLSMNYGLLYGIVACYFRLLGGPAPPPSKRHNDTEKRGQAGLDSAGLGFLLPFMRFLQRCDLLLVLFDCFLALQRKLINMEHFRLRVCRTLLLAAAALSWRPLWCCRAFSSCSSCVGLWLCAAVCSLVIFASLLLISVACAVISFLIACTSLLCSSCSCCIATPAVATRSRRYNSDSSSVMRVQS